MICPICQQPITRKTAHGIWRVTCSEACRRVLRAKGQNIQKATAGRKRASAARLNQRVAFYFGTLSDRELALVRYVWRHAYQRALQRAYYAGQRHVREAAA